MIQCLNTVTARSVWGVATVRIRLLYLLNPTEDDREAGILAKAAERRRVSHIRAEIEDAETQETLTGRYEMARQDLHHLLDGVAKMIETIGDTAIVAIEIMTPAHAPQNVGEVVLPLAHLVLAKPPEVPLPNL